MGRLTGKTALVTGAARGIGRAIALRFATEGANLVLCDLNLESLREVAVDAESEGVKALPLQTDVAVREQVQQLVDAGISEFGAIHSVVNNAGIFFNAPFEQTTDEQYERIMAINVKSVFLVSQIVIRHWLRRKIKGTIVNLASIGAAVAFVDSSAYCTTKGAVATMTRCIALEYGPRGIRANSMAPGIIDTPMLPSAEDSRYWANNTIPLRRLGEPNDVADVALFLASEESRYITGEMIFVDGGWMLN
ncbi:MAG: SDR family NAD(P)-dependent oxidoreductase [Chloroflexota bacterium]|nr:SDR family NAD(P)-dependent oxidoreductase [Chloroflexota bacterium]